MAVYITAFVVPENSMRIYLESYGNVFDDPTRPSTPDSPDEGVEEEEQEKEDDEDKGDRESEEDARLRREDKLFHRYVSCFRRVRQEAPPELRTKLEIPSSPLLRLFDIPHRRAYSHCTALKVVVDQEPWRKRLFIQAGAFRKHQQGNRNKPNAQDERAIANFIEASNCLLPDDKTREQVGFHRQDMEFHVVPSNAVWTRGYIGNEREEIIQMRKSIREEIHKNLALGTFTPCCFPGSLQWHM
ncbi:hypothetical protein C8Q74DRAFT_989814 [Fomes fomentarius]|nr:hypothetical protein C8Q74DRAFT_989814 [Fomes fomentarius]